MSLDLSKLTDSAQKEYSKLLRDIKFQKGMIEKCKAYTKESPSDALKRAKAGYEHHIKQVDAHNAVIESRLRKQEEQNILDIQEAKDAAAKKIKDIITQGDESLASKQKYLKDAEEKLEKLENEKSRQQVNAEIELDKLNHALESLKDTLRIPTVQTPKPTQPPLTQAPEPVPEPVPEPEDADDNGYKAFLELDFNKPEKPLSFITNNFSYCSAREAKEEGKGMQGLVQASSKWDSSIYGRVSDLSKAKKQIRTAGVKA